LDASALFLDTNDFTSRVRWGKGKTNMYRMTRSSPSRPDRLIDSPVVGHSRRLGRPLILWISFVAISVMVSPLRGQEINWRRDYNAARKEATEKSLPLILDVGTENCFWCKKLDATTFRDPTVASVLNGEFIPLRVDAEREAALADALRISTYPTLVLASPGGKILGTLEGYMEAPRLHEHLQRVLAGLNNPEWMKRDYQEASKAIASADHARAVALLKAIVDDGGNRAVQIKAKQLLSDLEQLAAGRLARAKQMEEKGQTSEAINTVSDLIRSFAGTQAATEGSALLTSLASKPEIKAEIRTRRARDLLAQAREDYRTQQYLCCLDRCEVLVSSYGDLSEGIEAGQLAAEVKNNPEWLQQACDSLSDRLGGLYLALAESWIKKGQPQQAALYLERVVRTFPGTRQAETAQVRLSALNGRPTLQTEFKK
jgi:thioredoxin-like negative regulator of GroEL